MAYFSNGTEGMMYESQYCDRCINNPHDALKGCPVWDLHFEYNYDQNNKTKIGKAIKNILESFIPTRDDGFAGECLMFREGTATRDERAEYFEKLRYSDEPVFGID
jgi:hypothetical protein